MATAKQELPPITPAEVESPIINSPFIEPQFHWQIERGKPPIKAPGRRRASYFYRVPEHAGRGQKSKSQQEMFEAEKGEEIDSRWSTESVNGSSCGAKELTVLGWHTTALRRLRKSCWTVAQRRPMQRLFFAQIEAVETVIFLVEAGEIYRKGLPEIPKDEPGLDTKAAGFKAFVRYACKMATGSGKTTVMGMLAHGRS